MASALARPAGVGLKAANAGSAIAGGPSRASRLPRASRLHARRSSAGQRLAVRSAYVSPVQQAPPGSERMFDLELPTDDFQKSVELISLRRKKGGTAILVQEVTPGSSAANAGIRPGQQVLAVSDPVRQTELWELGRLTALKYVKQAVAARAQQQIRVRVTGQPLPEWEQAVSAARSAVASRGGSFSDGEDLSDEERAEVMATLEKMDGEAKASKLAAREEKLEQRRSYEQENIEQQRTTTPFFAVAIALVVLLPTGFIVAALASGSYMGTGAFGLR